MLKGRKRWLLATGIGLVAVVTLGAVFLYGREPMVEVRLAVPERMRSATVYVAMDKGYFKDQNLHVSVTPIITGKEALERTLAGEFDLAAVAGMPVLRSLADGQKVVILGSLAQAEKHVAIVTTQEIGTHLEGLRGKRVGVAKSTTSEMFLLAMLDAVGISSKEIEIVPLMADEVADAVPSGKVDAVSAWDPVRTQARQRLGERGVEIPNNGVFVDYWLLAGADKWLAANPKVAERLMRALFEAGKLIQAQPEEARAITERWVSKDADPWDSSIYVVRLDRAMRRVMYANAKLGLGKADLPGLDGAIRPEPLRAAAPTAVTLDP